MQRETDEEADVNILLKFENGAEIPDEMECQCPPEALRMPVAEGCTFYFRLSGPMPSGTLLYLEASKADVFGHA